MSPFQTVESIVLEKPMLKTVRKTMPDADTNKKQE